MTLAEMGISVWVPIVLLALGATVGWLAADLSARRKLTKLGLRTQDIGGKLDEATAGLAQATAKVTDLQAKLDTANADLAARNADLAARDAELAELKREESGLRGTAEQSFTELSTQVRSLKTDLDRVSQENESLSINLETTAKDLIKARADFATATQSLSNKDVALTEAYARAVKLEHEASDEESQLLSLQAEAATLKRQLAMLTVSNQDLDRRLQNARGEVAGELAVLTSTMLRVKDEQLTQANATVAALQAQLAMTVDQPVLS